MDLALAHHVAMAVLWGPDLTQIYNDSYRTIAGDRHPQAFGRPVGACGPALWDIDGEVYDAARRGETRWFEGHRLTIQRRGRPETAWFDLCISPVHDESGTVGGILVTVIEKTQQVRAQAERARSQRLFESIADATPEILYVLDVAHHRSIYSNRRIEQVLGYTPRQVAALDDVNEALLHPEDKARVLADLAGLDAIAPGETLEHEFRMRHSDGSYRWLRARNVVLNRDSAGRAETMLGLAEDITDRKEAEAALRASEERLRIEREFLETLIRQAPIGILIAEASTGRAIVLNERAIALLGHDPTDQDARRHGQFGAIHPDGRPYADGDYPTTRALRRGEVVEQEDMIYRRGEDGRLALLSVSSSPIRDAAGGIFAAVTVFIDIEEQRRAEIALRHQFDLNRTITEHTADALFMMDADGRVTFSNPAAVHLFGWQDDELIGRMLHETIHHHRADGSAYPAADCPLLDALRSGRELRDHEDVFFRKDGSTVPVICSNAPIIADGAVSGAVLAVHDISARKRAEEDLRASHERTFEILESISDAFYAVDQEWRFTYVNRKAEELWKRQRADLIGKVYWHEFPQAVGSEPYRAHLKAAAERRPIHLEAVSPILKQWIELSIYPTADGGLSVYFRDITERKRAEEHRKLLLAELSHRVKNTLASVQSIASQTLRSAESPAAFRQAFTDRLLALSKTHDLLSQSNWRGAGLRAVLTNELQPHLAERASHVSLNGEDVDLGPRTALAIAMAFHELATNAAKYGALSTPSGRLDISWEIKEAGDHPQLHLQWLEVGGPTVAPPTRRGFGSVLIERGLAYELDGEVSLHFGRSGVRCEMRIPLSSKRISNKAGLRPR